MPVISQQKFIRPGQKVMTHSKHSGKMVNQELISSKTALQITEEGLRLFQINQN